MEEKNFNIQYPKNYVGLSLKHIDKAVEEALHEIDVERADEQNGLYCAWKGINRGQGRYWRFNHVTQLAAPSGDGKSFSVNQLLDDFTDFKDIPDGKGGIFRKALNGDYKGEVICCHFGLEMDGSDEVIRMLSRKIGQSHSYILSSEYNDVDESYNKITDEERSKIENRMNYIKGKPIYYVELGGTTEEMYATVGLLRTKFPNARLVISIDHSLLVKRGASERTDMELVAAVAYFARRVRQVFKAMVIILGQTNNNLFSVERLTTPSLHTPMASDIYLGSQINWACDNIWIMPYRPELHSIRAYGISKRSTKDLIVCACVKSRKGVLGDTYLRSELSKGKFVEF